LFTSCQSGKPKGLASNRRAVLAELAREAGLSVPHYSAMFSRRTGLAPIDYFLRLKIQRACQLLETTAMLVEEVAAAVGCDDPFYFFRLFKKIMGHSPRAYRNIQKG
jgi:AraC-like DNA-binding protein